MHPEEVAHLRGGVGAAEASGAGDEVSSAGGGKRSGDVVPMRLEKFPGCVASGWIAEKSRQISRRILIADHAGDAQLESLIFDFGILEAGESVHVSPAKTLIIG